MSIRIIFKHIVTFALSVAAKPEVNPGKPVLPKLPDVWFCPPLLFGLVSCAHCQGWVFVEKPELLIYWVKKAKLTWAWYLISFSLLSLYPLPPHLPENIKQGPWLHLDQKDSFLWTWTLRWRTWRERTPWFIPKTGLNPAHCSSRVLVLYCS